MISLSLCMIVKNEELKLSNCLNSLKNILDEIIIIDTGSTDKTKEIAKTFTDKVFDFIWIDDFSAARNFSFSKATCDYIMWLDADDVLSKEEHIKLKMLKDNFDTSYDSISMIYDLGISSNENNQIQYKRNRIVKRSKNFKWIGFVHEFLNVDGKILESDIHITHMKTQGSSRNLDIYKKKIKEGYNLAPRDTYYYGKELFYNGFYDESIDVLSKVIDSTESWVEQQIDCINCLCDIYIHKNMTKRAREVLTKAFELTPLRGETLYRYALSFQVEGKYELAISWYEMIDKIPIPSTSLGGFVYTQYYTWLPHIQQCVCYYALGDVEKSKLHNDIAFKINSYNIYSLENNEFFKNLNNN